MRFAHIIGQDVVNVIEIDPASAWRPDGGYVVASETAQIGWRYANGAFVDPTPPAPRVAPDEVVGRRVRKVLIVDRIQQAGKLDAAFAKLGGPGKYLYERWQAAPSEVLADDEEIQQLLEAMGLDPGAILAPE